MPKGDKVRKGFFFYVMMLLLFIIAIFLILVVIMIFNPGMNILGLKYFSAVQTQRIDSYVDGSGISHDFDLSSRTDIYISGNRIDFGIEVDQNVEKVTFEIENYQTGFATSDQSTTYDYSLSADEDLSTIEVNITNPEGFLYFNSHCYVRILVPEGATFNPLNTLNVSCGAGSINLGNATEEGVAMDIDNLSLATTTGSIQIGVNFDSTYTSLAINNENGSFHTYQQEMKFVNGGVLALSGNGSFEFGDIVPTNDSSSFSIQNNIERGSLSAGKVDADMALKTINATINIDTYSGNLESNNLVNETDGMNLTIGTAEGEISLPFANNSNITISNAENCDIFVNSNNAHINIGNLGSTSWIETESGSIDVSLSAQEGNIYLVSETAAINVTGNQNLNANLAVTSISGAVNFDYYQTSRFTVSFFNADGEARENVSVEGYDTISNPMYINGGGATTKISTNGNINLRIAS